MQSERNVGVGEVLTVDSVTRQDGGLYVCTADNGAGSKSRDFVIDVQCMSFGEYIDHPPSDRGLKDLFNSGPQDCLVS